MRSIAGVVALLIMAPQLWAARPLATDDAGTVEAGKSETEMSFDYCRHRPGGTCQSPSIFIKHGLTGRMDVGLGFSHNTEKDGDGNTVGWGMSPLEVGLKLSLIKEQAGMPDVSVSSSFETGSPEYGLNFIFRRAFGNLGLHFNLGYNSPGEIMARGSIATSLAAEYTFGGRFRVCGELCGEILDDRSEVLGNNGMLGGSITFGPYSWDFGLRVYDRRGPKTKITTGITAGF